MSKTYTITAALPYTNGPIHIGHLAGVYVPADIYARYLRIMGNDVVYISGSDEHGVPITIKAKKENKTPQEIVDRYHQNIKNSFSEFGISFDSYSRTSAKIHHDTASEFFLKLLENNSFEELTSEQFYDEEEKQFLPDRFLIGTCPKCGFEESYGDQCEKCGTSHNPRDLINPRSSITGNKPSLRTTKHWYLKLDKFQGFLEKWILEDNKGVWKSNVYGQCKSWLDDGLKPRAVTRDLDWGIPVPVKDSKGKVLYVWFDAPIGYISSTKKWAIDNKQNWEKYWKDNNTELIHFIGKDNIVFHCIIFPAMLKAHGDFIIPKNVPANEFLNIEGSKISTSKNWAVWLPEFLNDFPGKQDVLRYVLTINAPENKDNDFTWKDFQNRNNGELVAILGNFINRVVILTKKYYESYIPANNELLDKDKNVLDLVNQSINKVEESLSNFKFRDACSEFMNIARIGNKYLADEEPWKIIKENPERVKTVIFISLHISSVLAIVSEPFIPFTSKKIKNILNFKDEINWSWNGLKKKDFLIYENHKINEPELLFNRIEDSEIQLQIDKLHKNN